MLISLFCCLNVRLYVLSLSLHAHPRTQEMLNSMPTRLRYTLLQAECALLAPDLRFLTTCVYLSLVFG